MISIKKCIQGQQGEKGFTLIELSLAMAFLAFIMLFIVAMIVQMINIYNKSISLSQMNQASRQIMSDLNSGARFTSAAASVVQSGGGRLCAGGVSYIWNIGLRATDVQTNYFVTSVGGTTRDTNTALRLVRIDNDSQAIYCINPSRMPVLDDANTIVLVGANVLVQNFAIDFGGNNGNNGLMRLDLVLSTSGNNAPSGSLASGFTCGNNNFCAFSSYKMIIYQGGSR